MSESEIERLFREAIEQLWPDTPRLVQEHKVYKLQFHGDTKAFRRLDFALPDRKLGIELDGWSTHSSPEQIADDRLRKRVLEDAGWKIRYYGGQEVKQDALGCVRDALRWAGLEEKRRSSEPLVEALALLGQISGGPEIKVWQRQMAKLITKGARQLAAAEQKLSRIPAPAVPPHPSLDSGDSDSEQRLTLLRALRGDDPAPVKPPLPF
jgi:very-short-patch-repair endonuclease